MLTAIREKDSARVCADDLTRQHIHGTIYADPFLRLPVFFRKGHIRKDSSVRPHFVSKGARKDSLDDVLFDADYLEKGEGGILLRESMAHIQGKHFIAEWVQAQDASLRVEYEHRVEIKRKSSHRIIDVAAVFPNNQIIACECQISPISTIELRDRIYDYFSEDIDCIWFLGKAARTAENQSLLYQEFGEIPFLDFD